MKIRVPYDFAPRSYQGELMAHFDQGRGRRAVAVWHRRAGKDLTLLNQLAKVAVRERGVYWHMLPTYEQGRKAIWLGFRADGKRTLLTVFPKALVRRPSEWPPAPAAEMLIELVNGSIVQIVGSDNIDSVLGAGPRWITFSEFSLSKPSAWPLVRPILRENGGSAAFIFTPRGRNHAHKLYQMAMKTPGWYAQRYTIFDTGVFDDPEQVLAEERAEGMPEELVRQEYLCDFAASVAGSYYGDLVEAMAQSGQISEFDHERDVYTAWDLGVSDSTAIWFWRIGDSGVEVVDHYAASSKPLQHYFDELERRRYTYVRHWLPHDARNRSLNGATVVEQFVDRYGRAAVGMVPRGSLLDGIQAVRWLLQGRLKIHSRCDANDGIEALRQYHRAWDEDRKAYANQPYHDWASHSADAFRYLAQVVRTERELLPKPPPPKKPAPPQGVAPYSLDDLWAARDRGEL